MGVHVRAVLDGDRQLGELVMTTSAGHRWIRQLYLHLNFAAAEQRIANPCSSIPPGPPLWSSADPSPYPLVDVIDDRQNQQGDGQARAERINQLGEAIMDNCGGAEACSSVSIRNATSTRPPPPAPHLGDAHDR